MKLIDTHQHLIYRDIAGYSWTEDIPILSKNNFTIEDYHKLTEGLCIEGTLFMETGVYDADYQNEAIYIKKIAKNKKNGIKGLIVSIRPEDDKVVEYQDSLHEHFVYPCKIKNGNYMPPKDLRYSIEMKKNSVTEFSYPNGVYWRNN